MEISLMNIKNNLYNSKIFGVIFLSPAVDLPHRVVYKLLSKEQKLEMDTKGSVNFSIMPGIKWHITKKFIEDARQNNNFFGGEEFSINFPLTILHGKKDDIVEWQIARDITLKVKSPD